MKRFSKLLLMTAVIWASLSCSTLMRSGGALAGGSLGWLGGPVGVPIGVTGGIAAVDLILQEDEIEEQEEHIKALTMGDVEGYVSQTTNGVLAQVYNWLKVLISIVTVGFFGSWLYTARRKKVAQPFYDMVEELKEKIK
jgi:hypothetical protein